MVTIKGADQTRRDEDASFIVDFARHREVAGYRLKGKREGEENITGVYRGKYLETRRETAHMGGNNLARVPRRVRTCAHVCTQGKISSADKSSNYRRKSIADTR
ncbi:hypothetical protein PUN28_007046 [Cardiocondyla obscurior]|uniref:Uncharacterized protein n=1 Tax=Cardiocondyla obscurior TaxID=286306 RepID=A0AAW2G4M6_9HYME